MHQSLTTCPSWCTSHHTEPGWSVCRADAGHGVDITRVNGEVILIDAPVTPEAGWPVRQAREIALAMLRATALVEPLTPEEMAALADVVLEAERQREARR